MKKLTAWALLLAMIVAMFAGCSTPNEPAETTAPATAEDYLADATAYVRSMYKDKAGKVLRDFDVVASVKVGAFTYEVTWTSDVTEGVAIGAPVDNKITVDVNENPGEEDLKFTLTATVIAGEKSESTSFEFYVPGTPAKSSGPVFVEAPAAGSSYKFALVQAELGQTLYFTGEMNGYYLATSTNVLDAVDVTVEEVEGGYHLSFMKAGVKTYIDIIPREDNPGKVNVVLTEAPTAVFTWDAERKTMTAVVGDATWYLGTYNTYNTISASNVSYIEDVTKIGVSQFPATFATVSFTYTPNDAEAVDGSSYVFALVQAELGQTLYFTGEMSGYYLATSTNAAAAAKVYAEAVEGGMRFYFDKAGVKTYIDIIPREDNPGKVNVVLTETPTAVFTWDAERKTMTAVVGDATWYLGTYSTYNTISASNVSYIEDVTKIGVSQFPATFATINFTYTPNDAEAVDGSSYVFALVQAELGQTLYFTGEMNGYYLATSTNAAAAAKVTAEAVEGGMRFYILNDGVKTYIDIVPRDDNPAKVNVKLVEEPTAVYTWDAERKVYTAVVGETTWYLGTYGTYNTISASDVSYIEDVSKIGVSQFPAQLGTATP